MVCIVCGLWGSSYWRSVGPGVRRQVPQTMYVEKLVEVPKVPGAFPETRAAEDTWIPKEINSDGPHHHSAVLPFMMKI